jgi:hypothetical protein
LMYFADRGVNESSCPGVRVLGCPSAAIAAADRTRGQRLPGREFAGSRPKPRLHPNAVRVLRDEFGIDLTGQLPGTWTR